MGHLSGFSKRRKFTIDNTKVDAALSDFPVALPLSNAAGLGNDDLSSIFTELNNIVGDTFTGDDGDAPNGNLWTQRSDGTTDDLPAIDSNKLKYVSTGDKLWTESIFKLSGDFDIQVDFEFISSTAANFTAVVFKAYIDANNYLQNYFQRSSVGNLDKVYNGVSCIGGTSNLTTTASQANTYGKMRLVRSGTTWSSYYWGGSSWTLIRSDTGCPTTDVMVVIQLSTWDTFPSLSMYIDNFIINSGTVVWPEGNHANRKKIAVTTGDGATQCPVEIEWFDHETAMLHTKVPNVASGAGTDVYLYYDGSASDNSSNVGDVGSTPAQTVWDSNFKAVYHMAQDPSGGSNCVKDSTANANHGTPGGSMTADDLVAGVKGGRALHFDGSDDYISVPDSTSLVFGNAATDQKHTMEVVASVDVDPGIYVLLGKEGSGGFNREFLFIFNSGNIEHYLYDDQGGHRLGRGGPEAVAVDAFNHICATYDGGGANSSIDILLNAVAIDNYDGDAGSYTAMHDTASPLVMGYSPASTPVFYYLDGKMGEVRITIGVERTAAWLKATYHTLFDTFGTWGSEETPVGGTTTTTSTTTTTTAAVVAVVPGLGHLVVGGVMRKVTKTSMLRDGKWRNVTNVKVVRRGIFRNVV